MAAPPARIVRGFAPVADRLAGSRWVPVWAKVHHVGRRSGTAYAVPVAVIATPTAFVIGLPWGPQTNWARNVIAAGHCRVDWRGTEVECTDPVLLTSQQARDEVAGFWRAVLPRIGISAFIRLRRPPRAGGAPAG